MNRRILIIVSCALLLSVCASYLVYRAVGRKVTGAAAPRATQIIVASQDLEVGTLIHTNDLKTAAWLGTAPEGAVRNTEGLLNRGVASTIYAGEPVTEKRLALQGSGGGLAATIPPGMRACAVKVNEVVGVAGFVVSGMRVDVLITGLPPGGNPIDGARVRTLLQNIQVLSAGTNFQKSQEGKPEQAQVVNLLVTPTQAEILSLASNETHIQLVLRNPMDTQLARTPGTAMSDLFGRASTVEPIRPPAATSSPMAIRRPPPVLIAQPAVLPPYVIEISNGPVHSEVKINRTGGNQ